MRILVVKLSSIGDVVHTLPAVSALKRSLPDARISWVVERRASAILRNSPIIDQLIEIDSRDWRGRTPGPALLREVRTQLRPLNGRENATHSDHSNAGETFDAAIDFQGLFKSGLVAYLSHAPRRIGFETSELREMPSRVFLTEQVQTKHLIHVIEKNLALARRVIEANAADRNDPVLTLDSRFSSEQTAAYQFPISITQDDEEYIEREVAGRRFAIINPGGGWPTKLWKTKSYVGLIDWLKREHGLSSVVTFGPGEESMARSVVESTETGAAKMLASTLMQFMALARRADLFVGGDTGPLHLAAAAGSRIVGLYGPTSPQRNGPFDPRDVTVGRDLWCRTDCYRRSCWHWECMEITPLEVQRAISRRLEQGARNLEGASSMAKATSELRPVSG
jgi:lipopolysaccharide heptosyltransferase I